MRLWKDTRHQIEKDADERYARIRERRLIEADITTAVANAADRIAAYREGIREGRKMSKLGAVADRIKMKKEAHDAKADEWASRLDAIDRREPAAFAIGDAVIAERDSDLKEMEDTMRGLSNLPNVSSGS